MRPVQSTCNLPPVKMLGKPIPLALLACATLVVANFPVPRVEDLPPLSQTFADETIYRLPNNTFPVSYDVQLTTHIHAQNFTFSGVVAIQFRVITASNNITLHHRQLNIGKASLVLITNPTNQILLNEPTYNSVNEFLVYTLTTGNLVVNSQYILTIEYTGTLRDDDAGFYRSSYVASDGTTRWLATTQFEQTDARHAFPCYDEPAHRALFKLRMTHGSGYHVISNMPAESTVDATTAGYSVTTFPVTTATTPTYLLAFIVSDFASKTMTSSRGLVQRIFARPNAIEDGTLGIDFGIKSLDSLEKYFGINFAFPKMDQAAIPDFAAGAMENWGLVTYREPYLLFNEGKSTFTDRFNVATTIAHEYTHQWFGNLVTPKWWTYIWLNEGFATLFEFYGTDWVYPEWKILDQFVYGTLQNVMVSDATSATRPMTHYAQTEKEIGQLFDNIAYAKSGCVLRMLLNAFTEDSFKKGLISYLNLKKYSDATEEDLFGELEKAVKADQTLDTQLSVPIIFASWTRQSGFPIVIAERDYTTGDIMLSQERYLTVNESTQNPSIWWIPYNVATGSMADFSKTAATGWFGTRSATIKESSLNATTWLLLNKRQTGYYRVKYDMQNYILLSDALVNNLSSIHLVSRANLLDDAFDLARTGRLSYNVALNFTKYLEHETEYVPWASALRGLTMVDRLYAGNVDYAKFSKYLVKQLTHIYSDAGLVSVANEHIFRKSARNLAIQWSCRHGSETCLNQTRTALTSYLVSNAAIHQDHRATILCNGMRTASVEEFAALNLRLSMEETVLERNRLIDALACSSNSDIIEAYLHLTIEDNGTIFRDETERYRAFSEQAGISQQATKLAIVFLGDNFDAANTRYGVTNVNRALTRLASFVVNEERQSEFNSLMTTAGSKAFIDAATITTARATVAANNVWIERNSKVINEWINANGSAHVVGSVVLLVVLLAVSQLF